MKRVWIGLSGLLIVALVVGAGYWGFASQQSTLAEAPVAPLTVTAAKCDVQQTVTAPGSLVNTRTSQIEMPLAGQLAEVLARPGDSVRAGQVLARLAHREKYEAALATAQLELAQAQQALNTLQANAPLAAAEAQLAYVEALQELTKTQRSLFGLYAPDLDYYHKQAERAQDTLDLAEKNAALTELSVGLRQAQQTLTDAAAELANEQGLNAQYPGGFAEQVDRAQRNYNAALESFQNIKLRYEQAQINNTNTLEDAQADLTEAQKQLTQAQSQPSTTQVNLAQAKMAVKQALVHQAELKWKNLQHGPDALELNTAQARVDQAQAALVEAQQALEQLEITAPFAGVILESNVRAGETTTAGTALFTLADPQQVEAETTVIEEDVPYVQTEQAVEMYFDALPGEVITGTVTRIVPQRLDGDRPLYHVYLTLSRVPRALFEGMSVDAAIVIAQQSNVVCLPRALAQASANGSAMVEVWAHGVKEKRTLTLGLRGDTYVEVQSGLVAGEQVVAK